MWYNKKLSKGNPSDKKAVEASAAPVSKKKKMAEGTPKNSLSETNKETSVYSLIGWQIG